MTVCIQYARPASGQRDGEIFGLDVAVNNFLSAWFRYGTAQQFLCRPTDMPSFEHFKALASQTGIDAETGCIGLDPRHPRQNLGSISCLFRPDPLIGDLVWTRQQLEPPAYATCGLVHTMSGERIARAVGELCLAPTTDCDALICPSDAIRDAVRSLWDIYSDYLNHHFGSHYKCPIETPVIPLGINSEKFVRLTTADKRMAQRAVLGISEDEVVILFVGRLSFATKAHPLALFKAAETAAKRSKRKVRLVMFGYFKPQDMENPFRTLATETCKTAQVDFIMNDDTRFPDGFWAGADIFTSLSDNIQESFGLTPIEAMACGLPGVISNWDGYRNSIRHGVDGYLIPTITPPPSAGMAIAEAYYNEQNYGVALMGAVQSTAVDIAACADAFTSLIDDAAKRKEMGASAQLRAQSVFDWKHIIKAYEQFWGELGNKARTQKATRSVPKDWQAAHPAFPNPFQMFSSFPTQSLTPERILRVTLSAAEVTAVMAHEMNYFLPELLAPKETMMELIEAIRRAGRARIGDILTPFPVEQRDCILRCLGWMLKHGVCMMEGVKLG